MDETQNDHEENSKQGDFEFSEKGERFDFIETEQEQSQVLAKLDSLNPVSDEQIDFNKLAEELDTIERKSSLHKALIVFSQLLILLIFIQCFFQLQTLFPSEIPTINSITGFLALSVVIALPLLVLTFIAYGVCIVLERAKFHLLSEVLSWLLIPVGYVGSLIFRDMFIGSWWLLSHIYEETGRYQIATWLCRNGTIKSNRDKEMRAWTLANLSRNLARCGNLPEASKHSETAVAISHEVIAKDGYFKQIYGNQVEVLSVRAEILKLKGDCQASVDLLKKSLDCFSSRNLEDKNLQVGIYLKIARGNMLLGDYPKGKESLAEATEIIKEKEQSMSNNTISDYHTVKAAVELFDNNFEHSVNSLKKVFQLKHQMFNHTMVAEPYLWLARMCVVQNNLFLAEKYYRKAISRCELAYLNSEVNPIALRKELASKLQEEGRELEVKELSRECEYILSLEAKV